MNILLLAGSPSTPSRSTRLLHHVGERLALLGHRYVKLHVRDLPAQALVHADFNDEVLRVAREQVAQADAVVIATPVYKAAYSGILKAFLDLLPQDGLRGKLVLPLATGGSQSHMLAPITVCARCCRRWMPGMYCPVSMRRTCRSTGLQSRV